ncbi:molybdopterin-dependent oxidoreductase [Phenylobacterium aquaticum]|uniref:molybdopterin-containing oxidoreductase family protein n=1 Tax=Phenylobacterium aquaticum TaxID=1763816 RepID=UPI0026EBB33A|nr:molybdopterin-dependent oxidoreductase [Phenylobacterium aquaticum]
MTVAAERHHTICRACHAQCGLIVEVEDGRVARIHGDKDNPIYAGFSCIKGRELGSYHTAPTRLLRSQKRQPDGHLADIGSEAMMDEIAAKVADLVARHGPRSVALYIGTHGYNNFASSSFAKAWMDALGSAMKFDSVTIDQPGKAVALMLHGPWLAGTPTLDHWDVLTLIGANPIVSMNGGLGMNPARQLHRAKQRGMKLVVIDPRRTECAEQADVHLAVRAGEDAPVLAAIARELIAANAYDRDFVMAEADGFEALRAAVEPFTPEVAGARAGVDPADIRKAAELIGSARRGAFSAGTGANMSGHGNLVEYFVKLLTTLKGFWRRPGDEVANPGVLIQPFPAIAASPGPQPAWGLGETLRVRGLTQCAAGLPTAALAEEILTPGEGQVRALFVLGGNPILAWPDQIKTVEAMKALELLVCFDPHVSATARYADYVIAPTLPLEVCAPTALNEMIGNFGPGWGFHKPYAQWSEPVLARPERSDLLEEWEVFAGLADRLGLPLRIPTVSLLDPQAAAEQATRVEPGQDLTPHEVWAMLLKGSPVPFEEVRGAVAGRLFDRPPVVVEAKPEGWAGRVQIGAAPMMAELDALAAQPTEGPADPYPFRVISRRMRDVLNSSWHENDKLKRQYATNPAFLNPEDMARLGVVSGDLVEIESVRATIRGVAESAPDVRPGCVSMTHAWGMSPGEDDDPRLAGVNTGRLTAVDQDFDPYTGMPRMSAIPVRVRRAPA